LLLHEILQQEHEYYLGVVFILLMLNANNPTKALKTLDKELGIT